MGHCFGVGSAVGTSSPAPNPPLLATNQIYNALTAWVENGTAPETLIINSPDNTRSRPLCLYPRKLTYVSGDVNAAASFTCQPMESRDEE